MRRRKLVVTILDKEIFELAMKTNHTTLAVWGLDCAGRIQHYFEKQYPEDNRPKRAIEEGRNWVKTHVFKMAVIRKASLDAHAAARSIDENNPAHAAARSAGQAVASAHVAAHAVAASIYAATAVRNATDMENEDSAALKERKWQLKHLQKLREK